MGPCLYSYPGQNAKVVVNIGGVAQRNNHLGGADSFLFSYLVDPHAHFHMQSIMECYNMSGELEYDDEIRNINILEIEGSRDVAAPDVPTDPMSQPLNIRKVNIGTEEHPKFASFGDYWDEETMEKIIDMLHEFQDLFSTNLSEMKGTLGDLGEMNILLKLDVKLVR